MSGLNPKETQFTNFGILSGIPGCGKSTQLMKLGQAHLKGGGRVLCLPSNPSEETFLQVPALAKAEDVATFTGMKKIQLYEDSEFDAIAPLIQNCMVLSDDFRNYLKPQLRPQARKLFIERRHRRVHLYMACHSLTQVPPEIFNWVNLYIQFQTEDSPKRHANKFANLNKAMETFNRINQRAKTDRHYCEVLKSIN